jgi:LysR family transcriptional regulator, glycine cleavage system transcriptional activator
MFSAMNCDKKSHMKRRNVPLNALRAFEAVARLGRQIRAAEELGVTHGAISRQVRQLEDYLGVPLVEGTRHSPTLTEAGKSFAPVLRNAFNEIEAAIHAMTETQACVLDVACLSTFAMRWLIPRLHHFYAGNPQTDIRLCMKAPKIDVPQRRLDLSILVLDHQTKPNAEDIVLFSEQLGVVLAPSLIQEKGICAIGDLVRVNQLTTVTRPNAWLSWLEGVGLLEAHSIMNSPREYDHYYFAIEAAASGLGACVTPYHLVINDLAQKRLIAPFGFVETGYRYIARRHRPENRLATQFCVWLKNEAEGLKYT